MCLINHMDSAGDPSLKTCLKRSWRKPHGYYCQKMQWYEGASGDSEQWINVRASISMAVDGSTSDDADRFRTLSSEAEETFVDKDVEMSTAEDISSDQSEAAQEKNKDVAAVSC